jgi:hypothetical protein
VYWLGLVGGVVGGLLGLLVATLIAIAGFNMATNRRGKADQLADDYEEMLEIDQRRGLGWLHVNRAVSSAPTTYRLAGWFIFLVASLVVIGGGIELVTHTLGALQSPG